ncbi:unnamed protein product [Notodromas monacha]|uniref:Uncharacterized protein n=1 Tax=Notodromas monacha TaxID=399045 RepID=A0A7R9BNA8_9CRUS|nr:unnamed protein product [Notodromas monacha]CAG0918627.1 unnamed protein product [Notodromas monacha]
MSQTPSVPSARGSARDYRKDERSKFDSECLDSGFLSGNLDSVSCIIDSDDESPPVGGTRVNSGVSEQGFDKCADYACLDSGLILDSESGIVDEALTEGSGLKEEDAFALFQEAFSPDEDGDTVLHSAISEGFIVAVFSLVRLAPSGKYLDLKNNSSLTPVHLAVLRSLPWAVRRLVIGGCSLTTRDRNGNTPLHLACNLGDLESVQSLLMPCSSQEASLFPKPCPPVHGSSVDIELLNSDGLTSLHLAVAEGHFDIVECLLMYGADVNATDGLSGKSALHIAAEKNLLQMCKYLIHCGADPELESWSGLTAADVALQSGYSDIVDKLCFLGSYTTIDSVESDEEDYSSDEELANGKL